MYDIGGLCVKCAMCVCVCVCVCVVYVERKMIDVTFHQHLHMHHMSLHNTFCSCHKCLNSLASQTLVLLFVLLSPLHPFLCSIYLPPSLPMRSHLHQPGKLRFWDQNEDLTTICSVALIITGVFCACNNIAAID